MNNIKSVYMNTILKSSFLAISFILYGFLSLGQDNDKDNKDKTFN